MQEITGKDIVEKAEEMIQWYIYNFELGKAPGRTAVYAAMVELGNLIKEWRKLRKEDK